MMIHIRKPLVRRIWKMGIFLLHPYYKRSPTHWVPGSHCVIDTVHRLKAPGLSPDKTLCSLCSTAVGWQGRRAGLCTRAVWGGTYTSQDSWLTVKDRLRQWCAYVRTTYGFAHGLKGSCVRELQHHPALITTAKQWLQEDKAVTNAHTHTNIHTYVYIYTSPYACQVQHRDEFVFCRWPCPIRIASSYSTVIQFSF